MYALDYHISYLVLVNDVNWWLMFAMKWKLLFINDQEYQCINSVCYIYQKDVLQMIMKKIFN